MWSTDFPDWISLQAPSISQNLLDCIFAFPSNHPRFLKIYSVTCLLKKNGTQKIPQNQLKMFFLIIGWSIAQNDLKVYSRRTRRFWRRFIAPQNGTLWYSKFSLSLNVPKHAWIISLSLALYHPKHNSNSTQIQLNFNSKQLQPEKCDQSFFLFELPFKTPSISQNLLDCIFAFPSNHPRFLKIYSIAIFC